MITFTHPRVAEPKKHRVKSCFISSRLEFLDQCCNEYISLRSKSSTKFLHALFKEWWQTYPWCLADNEEPPTNNARKMKVLSEVGNNAHLKSKVEKQPEDVSLLFSWSCL